MNKLVVIARAVPRAAGRRRLERQHGLPLEHDRCSMAWWLQARQQRRRAAANKEVARSQQGMTRSKTWCYKAVELETCIASSASASLVWCTTKHKESEPTIIIWAYPTHQPPRIVADSFRHENVAASPGAMPQSRHAEGIGTSFGQRGT
ncbi:hypothetical protein HaLaN_23975 [Haematococcus lacustris]|uniref:Uncharacterized protein n=1 Tax=Haematococcus lacustris TaxID=44745 RepID=A0A6A0A2B3_HAELA|nr:hypothetical protein HaLaN_23975 [Haematococcus lacustris]